MEAYVVGKVLEAYMLGNGVRELDRVIVHTC